MRFHQIISTQRNAKELKGFCQNKLVEYTRVPTEKHYTKKECRKEGKEDRNKRIAETRDALNRNFILMQRVCVNLYLKSTIIYYIASRLQIR